MKREGFPAFEREKSKVDENRQAGLSRNRLIFENSKILQEPITNKEQRNTELGMEKGS